MEEEGLEKNQVKRDFVASIQCFGWMVLSGLNGI